MINFGDLKVGEEKREQALPSKKVIHFGRVIDLSKPPETPPEVKRQTLADLAVKEKVEIIPEPNLINTSVNRKTNDPFPPDFFVERKKLRYKKSSYLKDIWGE